MKEYDKVTSEWFNKLKYDNNTQIIYHYTSPSGLKGIFDNQKIRFSDRMFLNDTKEGILVFDLLKDHFEDIFPDDLSDNNTKEDLSKRITEFENTFCDHIPFKVYQVSFSLNGDSLPLWNYYTKNVGVEGYNIQFNSTRLAESIIKELWSNDSGKEHPYIFGHKIMYDKADQIKELNCFISQIYNAILKDNSQKTEPLIISKQQFMNRFESILEKVQLIGTYFKSFRFACEEEYRLFIYPYDNSDGDNKLYRFENDNIHREYYYKNGLFIPYIDLPFSYNTVLSITMSPTLSSSVQKNSLKEYIRVKTKNSKIVFNESNISIRY